MLEIQINCEEYEQIVFDLTQLKENPNYLGISDIEIDNNKYKFVLDINKNKTYVFSYYKEKKSLDNKPFIQESFDLNGKTLSHKEMILSNRKLLIKNFAFEEISEKDIKRCNQNGNNLVNNGILGLGRKFDNKIYNLLTHINEQYLIKKDFIVWKNKLIIGDLKKDFLFVEDNNKINNNLIDLGKYAIKFNGILISELNDTKDKLLQSDDINLYYLDEPAIFESNQKLINSDEVFMHFLAQKIFNNNCLLKNINNFKTFVCDGHDFKKIISNKIVLSFIFNGKLIDIKIDDFFFKLSSNEYMFSIVYSKIIADWTFGNLFFNEIIRTVFDCENNKIIFVDIEKSFRNINVEGSVTKSYKSIYLNSMRLNSYDWCFTLIIISNVFGILVMVIGLFGEKIISDLKGIKKRGRAIEKK